VNYVTDGTVFALSGFDTGLLPSIESQQQTTQGMKHRLTADCLTVPGKNYGFRNSRFADSTPGKAYGPHWLTR